MHAVEETFLLKFSWPKFNYDGFVGVRNQSVSSFAEFRFIDVSYFSFFSVKLQSEIYRLEIILCQPDNDEDVSIGILYSVGFRTVSFRLLEQ